MIIILVCDILNIVLVSTHRTVSSWVITCLQQDIVLDIVVLHSYNPFTRAQLSVKTRADDLRFWFKRLCLNHSF